MLIRTATPADADAIAAIYDEAVRTGTASFEIEPPGPAELARRMRDIQAQGYPYFAAEDPAGGFLGYAYASAYRPRIAYRFTVENSVYVSPGAQGRGVGRALLTQLIAACEAKGFRQMIAVIGDSANAGSIALHTACGFTHAGILQASGFKFGRWIDTVLMQRPLGTGDQDTPST